MSSVILSAVRTPTGSFLGSLSELSAVSLGITALKAAISKAGLTPDQISETIAGQVLTAGQGQAPARQTAIGAGIPASSPALTINKVCGSGMKAVMSADLAVRSGESLVVACGGQESMSRAPYLLPEARKGMSAGHKSVVDSMIYDGLWDIYGNMHMGACAESCAVDFSISRAEQDEYAAESYRRAINAVESGLFVEEISPVEIRGKNGVTIVDKDEEPFKVKFDKIPLLKPAFAPDGTVTPANASSINDGAAFVTVADEDFASFNGLKPIARIIAHASHSTEPSKFTSAPIPAVEKVLAKARLNIGDIDLFEINEAFSLVPIAAAKTLGIPYDKLNVRGGAVSLGHPIGASGARIIVTLIHALRSTGKSLGLASICIGGGEALAIIVETL